MTSTTLATRLAGAVTFKLNAATAKKVVTAAPAALALNSQ